MDLGACPDFMQKTIVQEFTQFVRTLSDEEDDVELFSLLDYIDVWLRRGNGFSTVGSDYTTFLLAVLVIIDAYERDPSMIDYAGDPKHGRPPVPRRARTLLDSFHGGDKYLEAFRFHRAAMHYARSKREPG